MREEGGEYERVWGANGDLKKLCCRFEDGRRSHEPRNATGFENLEKARKQILL